MTKERLSRLQKFILLLLSDKKEKPHSVIWLKDCALKMFYLDQKKPTKCKGRASRDVVFSRSIWGLNKKGLIYVFALADKKMMRKAVESGKLRKKREQDIRTLIKIVDESFRYPYPIVKSIGFKARLVQITPKGIDTHNSLMLRRKAENLTIRKGR